MVRSPSIKRRAMAESRPQQRDEGIRDFLERELPPGKTKEAPYLTDALLEAGARYDRYAARRNEWLKYAPRRARLLNITRLAQQLASDLGKLDILSRDDLASRVDLKQVEALVGSLHFLSTETLDLAKHVQEDGKPRDLAEERWILEIADIYENAFGQPAGVWGSGAGPTKQRGSFYHLLEVGRPISFPRHGKLSPRQIERTLKRRAKRKPKAISLNLSADPE